MSQSRRRLPTNRKRRIQHRLRDIRWSEQPEPMYTASNIHNELSDRIRGIDNILLILNGSGVPSVGRITQVVQCSSDWLDDFDTDGIANVCETDATLADANNSGRGAGVGVQRLSTPA